MSGRPKLTQKRRTQMLEAAAEVIGERGLCDTRIADVAGRAGLSPALVVYYFGSKEKLLTEALAYAEDLFYIEAFRELTGIEGAAERLARLIELACPPVERRETDEYWALWVELWSRALRNGEAARKREALDRRWRNTIAEVVREMMNKMCLDAATRELGLEPTTLKQGKDVKDVVFKETATTERQGGKDD